MQAEAGTKAEEASFEAEKTTPEPGFRMQRGCRRYRAGCIGDPLAAVREAVSDPGCGSIGRETDEDPLCGKLQETAPPV